MGLGRSGLKGEVPAALLLEEDRVRYWLLTDVYLLSSQSIISATTVCTFVVRVGHSRRRFFKVIHLFTTDRTDTLFSKLLRIIHTNNTLSSIWIPVCRINCRCGYDLIICVKRRCAINHRRTTTHL